MRRTEEMHIDYLAHRTEHIPALASWHHEEWSYLNPGQTLEERIEKLTRQARRDAIPLAVVALDDDAPLGSASLVRSDMDTHPEWTPWLASVYVAPAFRGQGVGTALVERITEEARRMDVETLYLFTMDRASFYARLGWEPIARETYRGEDVVVMRRSLV